MPQNMPSLNEDEARKELMASISAARELGPDMDDILADRYIERLNALLPEPTRDQARTHADLLTLLESAREHDASGDEARVSEFIRRARTPQPVAPVAPVIYAPQQVPMRRPNTMIWLPLIALVAVIAVTAAFPHAGAWWLIWVVPWMFWGFGRRRMGRYNRYDYRGRRYYRRHGYYGETPPFNNPRQLPPDNGPEIL